MHPTQGQLTALRDRQLDPVLLQQVEDHLAVCPACRAQAQILAQRGGQITSQLKSLDPLRPLPPSMPLARARLQAKLSQKESSMFQKIFASRFRLAWVLLGIALALAIAFSFPSVRALGNSFLGLFRVQQVTAFTFDPKKLETSSLSYSGENLVKAISEKAEATEIGEYHANVSAEEASQLTGLALRFPDAANLGEPRIAVQTGLQMKLQVDLPQMRALLSEAKLDLSLPDELDGATISGELPMAVTAYYGICATQAEADAQRDPDQPAADQTDAFCTQFIQVASPTIEAPAGLDVAALGEAFLQLAGMSPEEAKNFSQTVDWTTTLIIPVPNTTIYENVTVDGVQGVLVRQNQSDSATYVLIWSKDGVVYGLFSQGATGDALALAGSIK